VGMRILGPGNRPGPSVEGLSANQKGAAEWPVSAASCRDRYLALGNDRRRGLALADIILRAAGHAH
jgi:hypothetical protein